MSVVGIVCDNTCFGYGAGDVYPTQLFGAPFTNLGGDAFTLTPDLGGYLLTINGITRQIGASDITVTATGYEYREALVNNAYGVAYEQQELCPIPGVDEPATALMIVLGFLAVRWTGMIRRAWVWKPRAQGSWPPTFARGRAGVFPMA